MKILNGVRVYIILFDVMDSVVLLMYFFLIVVVGNEKVSVIVRLNY